MPLQDHDLLQGADMLKHKTPERLSEPAPNATICIPYFLRCLRGARTFGSGNAISAAWSARRRPWLCFSGFIQPGDRFANPGHGRNYCFPAIALRVLRSLSGLACRSGREISSSGRLMDQDMPSRKVLAPKCWPPRCWWLEDVAPDPPNATVEMIEENRVCCGRRRRRCQGGAGDTDEDFRDIHSTHGS